MEREVSAWATPYRGNGLGPEYYIWACCSTFQIPSLMLGLG